MSSLPTALAGLALTLTGATFGAVQALGGDDAERAAAIHVSRTTPLRELAAATGRHVGVAVAHDPLAHDGDYQRIVVHDFDTITLENELKWSEVHREPGVVDLQAAREMIDFAEQHGLRVRGHTLVWHRQLPDWLVDTPLGRDQAIGLLQTHITEVVGGLRGRVAEWDVVNEPIDPATGGLRSTLWSEAIGADHIDLAFHFARAADPDATLFLNDYDGAGDGRAFHALVDLAIDLRSRGVPVDGVGFQFHLAGNFDAESVAAVVQRAAAADLQVAFTEVDDRLPDGAGHVDRVEQARRFAAVTESCLEEPACTTVVVWGVSDAHSWVPGEFPGFGSATLFDVDFEPKPAYHFMSDEFRRAAVEAERDVVTVSAHSFGGGDS